MKQRWIRLPIGVAGVAVLVVAISIWLRPREPVYQGKPVSYWVKQMQNPSNEREARQGMHEMGARPFLSSQPQETARIQSCGNGIGVPGPTCRA